METLMNPDFDRLKKPKETYYKSFEITPLIKLNGL